MPDSVYSQLLLAVIVGISLAGLWVGEKDEKRVGGLLLISNATGLMVQALLPLNTQHIVLLLIEALTALALMAIAWRAARTWPIWAASFQTMSASVILVKTLGFHVSHNAYAAGVNIATYGVLGSLATGVFLAWREREALRQMSVGP